MATDICVFLIRMSGGSHKISGWGNYPKTFSTSIEPSTKEELVATQVSVGSCIPRGAGKSYGDASLGNTVLSSVHLNRTISFDREAGIFSCQSGKMLSAILDEIVPHGFFLPVTPGTKLITIGGAIGADIHGKNHHSDGCFSEHLLSFTMLMADGNVVQCSRTENATFFWATVGGMGLTGFIIDATFKLRKISTSKIVNRTIKCENLSSAISNLIQNQGYTYSVAWIDCVMDGSNLGRSLLYLGEHATESDVEHENLEAFKTPQPLIGLPFNLPNWTLNKLTVKAFNALFYGKVLKKDSTAIVDIEPYFYPLDVLGNWNRLYGNRGFVQYQFVIPMQYANDGMTEIVRAIVKSGESSFLAVLKLFGEQNEGWLSFPKKGIQLALDFRANEDTFKLLNRLDKMVQEMGGRSYLAKDARMSAEFFAAGYPKLEQFKQLLSEIDPNSKFRSLQSDRLGIT